MIKTWSLQLNEDKETYSLLIEDENYQMNIYKIKIEFDNQIVPHIENMQIFTDLESGSFWTIIIPDEINIL